MFKRIKKVPSVIQMEAVECGAACLTMILGFYGRYVSLAEMREACGISRDGSKAKDIFKAAKNYGLTGSMYTAQTADPKHLKTPFIAFWGFNHFIVVNGFHGNRVSISDPGDGEHDITEAEFNQQFTGVALCFEPNANFKEGGHKTNFIAALLRRLSGHGTQLSFLLLTGIGLTIPGILVPIFSKVFVDDYLVAEQHSWLKPLLIGMALTFIVQVSLNFLQSYYLNRFQTLLSLKTSMQFINHVLKLPLAFFNLRSSGDITQRFGLCDTVANLISGYFLACLLNLFTAFFYLILMCFYNVTLALVGAGITFLNIALMFSFRNRQDNLNRNLTADEGGLFNLSINGLSLIETYKSCAAEGELFSQWAGYFTKFMNNNQAAQCISQVMGSLNSLIVSLNLTLIVGLGGYFLMKGEITLGMLTAFQSLLIGFMLPFNQLIQSTEEIKEMESSFNRVDDILSYPVSAEKSHINQGQLEGNLEVKNLCFGYSITQEPLFKDLSLKISKGKSLGIIGASRCGGTTLANLLAGLYQPWSGEILLDNHPRTDYSRLILTHDIGFVGQSIHLFEGSIYDNICLWNESLPEELIVQAAKAACIHEIISKREGAYSSPVLEGARNFSGGEAQRLALARAFVHKPALLILDCATSALDAPIETKIYENIKAMGSSAIIIAHRLSSIRHCDEIAVLDQGQIIEIGTHDELVKKGGAYVGLIQ